MANAPLASTPAQHYRRMRAQHRCALAAFARGVASRSAAEAGVRVDRAFHVIYDALDVAPEDA
jgi:hypothetical protein